MRSIIFSLILAICFISAIMPAKNLLSAEKEITRAEFIKQLAESMGITHKLKESPTTQDYVNLLRSEGIKLPPDYDTSKIITQEEKADLLSQSLALERAKGEKEEIEHAYRDKAVIIKMNGDVVVKKEGEAEWLPAKIDMELTEGDYIKTGSGASVSLRVGVVGRIEIKENSEILLRTLATQADKKSEDILIYIAVGEMLVDARGISEKTKFETHTPTTIAAVRGTAYVVKVEPVQGKTEIREGI